ncbi:hypothetical protein KAU09_01500 [Candidatus Parcubacteria bacterium]|nr:hypothetical protein [Candidatus Parcubacteria bacterium]
MVNKKIKFINGFLLIALLFLFAIPVLAGPFTDSDAVVGKDSMLGKFSESAGFQSDESGSELGKFMAIIIKTFLSILGIIFIILIILAGFNWMTSEGDEQKVTKAKETIRTAIIGLFIIIAAYAITYFIFNALPFGGNVG